MTPRFKIAVFSFLLFLASFVFVHAVTRVSEFYANRDRNSVVLLWATEEESNLLRFDIERSSDGQRWIHIGQTAAIGESTQRNTYTFRDNTIFKTSVNSLYYRLVLVEKTGGSSVFHVIASAEGESGIRHTWGSIKAMFR